MSENLPLPGFEPMESSESTQSAAASPAKTFRWLERVEVLTESEAAYGESSPVWLANFDPATRSWRTSGLFAAEDSPLYSETLPRSGLMERGTLFLLPPLVRLIYANGAGSSELLPTPLASEADKPRRSPSSIAKGGGRKLMDALLPTPIRSDNDRGLKPSATRQGGPTLRQRLLIPTPTAGDAKASGSRNTATSNANFGLSLTDWARGDSGAGRLLPTPQESDFRNCADYSDGSRGHSPQLRHLGNGQLRPRFVEWMMNYPPGWTDLLGFDTHEPDALKTASG